MWRELSLKARFFFVVFACLCILLTVIAFLPASWLGSILEKQTNGRVSLGDVQGSFWQGSAFIGVAADQKSAVTALFPGRFSWKISPKLLLGQIDVEISNNDVLTAPVQVSGSFTQWRLSPASLRLPPERLEGLGAPLNTIGPSGKIWLRWDGIEMTRVDGQLQVTGRAELELNDMASRASLIKPLGSYVLSFQLMGQTSNMVLTTSRGPMMLEGSGSLSNGKFQFSGKAYAQVGQEEKLANLLNLLGRRRQEGDKQIIALEYR
ncbi:type II secretion system protein N [Undibacterium sp. LX40W]|uniref:Type II secretion system protein N n=1 Tax=Undibacterium nitidum TaxID=2762298 RepID=A0A923HI18_9BURK|nr:MULTISPECIES: type II secretion system protein N [Undibacterium]MBC3879769.1 type II secretion system protein N [Undibacterium nitidum]MBC3891495.1 type II secretion system protein N [Undibacterium sp. LX40W]